MPMAKRRKIETESYWSQQGSLESNFVIKKSRRQLEKEAAIRAQQIEKENELKEAFKSSGGIVVKIFDNPLDVSSKISSGNDTEGRSSKSPSKRNSLNPGIKRP